MPKKLWSLLLVNLLKFIQRESDLLKSISTLGLYIGSTTALRLQKIVYLDPNLDLGLKSFCLLEDLSSFSLSFLKFAKPLVVKDKV